MEQVPSDRKHSYFLVGGLPFSRFRRCLSLSVVPSFYGFSPEVFSTQSASVFVYLHFAPFSEPHQSVIFVLGAKVISGLDGKAIDFVTEATNTEIELFGEIKGIDVSAENIKHIANIKTRRLIKLLSSTNNIATFMRKASRTKTSLLKKYGINAQINGNNELVLPTNNVVELNRTLEFLNEDIFRGVITDSLYHSNSKKKDNHQS